jgi:hypothetical protein
MAKQYLQVTKTTKFSRIFTSGFVRRFRENITEYFKKRGKNSSHEQKNNLTIFFPTGRERESSEAIVLRKIPVPI